MVKVTEQARQKYWEELAAVASALSSNFTKLIQHPGKVSGNVMDGGQLWSSEYTITVNPELSERNDSARLEPVDPYLARNLLVNLSAEFPEFSEIKDWRELTRENITEQIINRLNLVAHRRCFKEYSDVDQSFLEVNHSTSSIADNTPNIDSLIDSFMEHKRASGNSSAYLYSLERKLRVFAGYHTGLPVHPELIEKYLSRFSNETATGQDAWKVLSMLYGFAEKRFGVNNPMGDVRKPKFKRKPGQRMSLKQVRQFLTVIDTDLDWALVVCYFGLRLRRSEACRLYFRDIREDFFVVHGKERTEELPLLPSFRGILLKLQNGRSLDSAVFSGKNGPLHSDTLATHIEQLFKKAGIKGVRGSPHTLRNTAGRLWLVYGGDQGSNRQLLRHSTQTMTDHYSELNIDELMDKERRHNPMLHLMHELGHEVPELLSSGPNDWDIPLATGR